MNLRFSWSENKNAINKMKHGISFQNAARVFSDPMRLETYDRKHSTTEERWKTTGFVGASMLVVIFTERDGVIHLISAREADKKEMKEYFYGYGTLYIN